MPMMPQPGGDAAGLMQLLSQMAPPSPMMNEASPVPQDMFAADRAQAAYDAFNPNPDTNGEGYLPLGDLSSTIGQQLGGGVEQQVAQSLVQSAMAGELDLGLLLQTLQQITMPQGMDPVGYQNPEQAFNFQYQTAMPGAPMSAFTTPDWGA